MDDITQIPTEQLQATLQSHDQEGWQKAAEAPLPDRSKPLSDYSDDELQLAMKSHQIRQEKELAPVRAQVAKDYPTTSGLVRSVAFPRDIITGYIYGRSKQALDEERATDADRRNVAIYEQEHQRRAQAEEGAGGFLAGRAMELPSQAAGFMIGNAAAGAVTPAALAGASGIVPAVARAGIQATVTPNLGPQMVIQKNIAAGRDPLDLRGVPEGLGLATAQMIVLHATGGLTGNIAPGAGQLGQIGVQALSGPFAQAATDVVTSAVGLDAGYGTVGKIVNGDYGEALKHAAGDVLMFGAFAAMHGQPEKGQEVAAQAAEAMKKARAGGASETKVAEAGQKVVDAAKTELAAPAESTAEPEPAPPVHAAEEIPGEFGPPKPPEAPVAPESPQAAPPAEPAQPSPEAAQRAPEQPQPQVEPEPAPPAAEVAPEQPKGPPEGFPQGVDLQTAREFIKAIGGKAPPASIQGPELMRAAYDAFEAVRSAGARNVKKATETAPEGPSIAEEARGEGTWQANYAKAREGGASHEAAAAQASKSGRQTWVDTGNRFTEERPAWVSDPTMGAAGWVSPKSGKKYVLTIKPMVEHRAAGDESFRVEVHTPEGERAGYVQFFRAEEGSRDYRAGNVEVDPRFQKQGIAEAMYDFAAQDLGQLPGDHPLAGQITPSIARTQDVKSSGERGGGQALWRANAEKAARKAAPDALLAKQGVTIEPAVGPTEEALHKEIHDEIRRSELDPSEVAKAVQSGLQAGEASAATPATAGPSVTPTEGAGAADAGTPAAAPAVSEAEPLTREQIEEAKDREVVRAESDQLRAEAQAKGRKLLTPKDADYEDAHDSEIDPSYRDPDAIRASARERVKAADRAKMAEMKAAKDAVKPKPLTPEEKGQKLSRARVEARHPDIFESADEEGIPRADVHAAAQEKLKYEQKQVEDQNEVHDWLLTYKGVKQNQKAIRKGGNKQVGNKSQGEELASVKGGDEASDWLEDNHPNMIRGGENAEDAVYRIIQEGRQTASEEDAYRHALDYHIERKRLAEEEAQDVGRQAQRIGRRFTEEDRRALERELQGEGGGAEEEVLGEAGAEAGGSGDFEDFAFGANAPEPEPAADLTKQERFVIDSRQPDENGKRRSLQSIGQALGVTRERVRQIEAAALAKQGKQQSLAEQSKAETERAMRSRLERERSRGGGVQDLMGLAEEGGRQITQKMTAEEARAESAADAFLRAAEEAGGSPEERRQAGLEAFARKVGVEPAVADKLVKLGVDFLKEEGGFLDPHQMYVGALNRAAQLAEGFKRASRYLGANWGELSGQMFPRITRLGREAGEAVARFVSAPAYARVRAPQLIDKVLGPNAPEGDRTLYGAVMTEMHLRYTRNAYFDRARQESNEGVRLKGLGDDAGAAEHFKLADAAGKIARRVSTVIGQPDSPLPDFAAYKAAVTSPRWLEIREAWKQHMVPEMEDNYRRSQGLDPTDPIDSFTQVPDYPMNLLAAERPGGTGTADKPNFSALKMGKNPFSNQRQGNAEQYNLDLGDIITNSINRGATNAAKAEAIRTMVDKGVAEWGVPGQRIDGAKEFPFTKPPRGTQENEQQETSLYVHSDAAKEWTKALNVATRFDVPLVTGALNAVTKAALASTAEATYHSRNLLTFLTKPGVMPQDLVRNAYGVIAKSPEVTARIVELARIGAMKEHGFESPTAFANSAINPLNWMGKLLGVLDKTMRLTADSAFDRLQRQGRAEGSETNRRDFINQLGQYNRRAQNDLVVMLRETGLGPFATAGSNYYAQGLKALTLNPGVKATSAAQAAGLRAEYLARTVGALSMVGLTNYLVWGRVDGDDKTPLGAIKTGVKDGKVQYIDVMSSVSGLTRGAREVGALAMMNGKREGKDLTKTEDKAVDAVWHSLLHPAAGPGVQFAYTAATGKNTMGFNIADKPEPGVTHAWENVKAAIYNANPAVATLTGRDRSAKERKSLTAADKANKLLGPFGVQSR